MPQDDRMLLDQFLFNSTARRVHCVDCTDADNGIAIIKASLTTIINQKKDLKERDKRIKELSASLITVRR